MGGWAQDIGVDLARPQGLVGGTLYFCFSSV
jgi:hypothetical protein